jgi:ABC-2 type transport system ATP-binding protein
MNNAVELKNVTKRFGNNTILSQINLTIPEGQIVGIIGKNGSGKSMLFKVISGLVRVSEGEVRVWDKEIGRNGSFPEDTGFLIERPGFLPHLSGIKNLQILADIQKKVDRVQVQSTIRLVGLDPDMKRSFAKYSLGMKQKLGIAQALMEKPRLLVLDEPMNNLDEESIARTREILMDLNKKEGVTILMTSHDEQDIRTLCNAVYLIKDGTMTAK